MINIDMWYGDNYKDCDKINLFFNDIDARYWGWIYKNNKIIGDYTCTDSIELEKTFSHLVFNWD